ncbi:MAG TPA: GDSL-type esterase/lipase family protein [Gemmataceae bacterium]|jgi:lysophospholipase L1-like esterase
MMTQRRGVLLVLATAVMALPAARSQPAAEAARKEAARIARWEPQIAAFEKQDAAKPTSPGGIVFTGSSTIRLWDLKKSFPDLAPLNRGFGGSHLADVRAYLPRLVLKHKPRVVVIHAGGNDLAAGKPPAQVVADFVAVHKAVRAALPDCRVVFIGIKPTLKRLALRDKEREVNDGIRKDLAAAPGAVFVEADQEFCDAAGRPRADLLRDDQLHLNDAGYAILTRLVRPALAP